MGRSWGLGCGSLSMAIIINLRHLEKKSLVLQGTLEPQKLDLDDADDLIHLLRPLIYDLEVQKSAKNLLIQGKLRIVLDCECARCLNKIEFPVCLDPWVCHLALEGDERVEVVNDHVDLTPYIREDIVLAFPQQPLCDADCKGLTASAPQAPPQQSSQRPPDQGASPWSALDKLRFRE